MDKFHHIFTELFSSHDLGFWPWHGKLLALVAISCDHENLVGRLGQREEELDDVVSEGCSGSPFPLVEARCKLVVYIMTWKSRRHKSRVGDYIFPFFFFEE